MRGLPSIRLRRSLQIDSLIEAWQCAHLPPCKHHHRFGASACAGVVVWDLIIAGNGALAGLVSITGPCGFVNTWAAFIIGGIGGFVYFVASKVNLNVLKVSTLQAGLSCG